MTEAPRSPLPPFDADSAAMKVRAAEDAWNARDPQRVSLAYSSDSIWRNRAEFLQGREAIVQFLTRKWANELDYRLIKELWAYHVNRIAVRFAYEWHDNSGNWFRSYGAVPRAARTGSGLRAAQRTSDHRKHAFTLSGASGGAKWIALCYIQ